MTTPSELERSISAWLVSEAPHRAPDDVLEASRHRIRRTQQRRRWWPVWRPNDMNTYSKLLAGAAAVLVVAVVGWQFLPGRPGAGGPSVGPSPSSPSATQGPTASAPSSAPTRPAASPSAGPLGLGRQQVRIEGLPMTLEIAQPGWAWDGEVFVGKGAELDPQGISLLLWPYDPDFVYLDSCGEIKAPPVGPAPADIAEAIAGMSQLELVSGPTAVTVDGHPAQNVVVRVPDEIDCEPNAFWLWGDASASRYATAAGSTYSVWIVDVDGNRIQIDAESFAGAGPDVEAEIQALIASIRFE